MKNCLTALDSLDTRYANLELNEMYDTTGGALLTVVIAGVTYKLTAKALAAIVAGSYGIGYALGQGWAYVVK